MKRAEQLPLHLPLPPNYTAASFITNPSNWEALEWVQRWPNWPMKMIAIYGERGCGKTHLAHIWQERSKAHFLTPTDILEVSPLEAIQDKQAIILDDIYPFPMIVPAFGHRSEAVFSSSISLVDEPTLGVEPKVSESKIGSKIPPHLGPKIPKKSSGMGIDSLSQEDWMFHFYNLAKEKGVYLLLCCEQPPAQWKISLPDLRSRLATILSVGVSPPDEEVLKSVLFKLCVELGMNLTPEAADYILHRVERSFDSVRDVVRTLDYYTLSTHRQLTLPLIREVLSTNSLTFRH